MEFSPNFTYMYSTLHATIFPLCNVWDFSVFLCMDYESLWKAFYQIPFSLENYFVISVKTVINISKVRLGEWQSWSYWLIQCQMSVSGQERIMSHTGFPPHAHSLSPSFSHSLSDWLKNCHVISGHHVTASCIPSRENDVKFQAQIEIQHSIY
jgi:hypothetical protein